MRILHVDLKLWGEDQVELRFFWDNPNEYQPQTRSLSAILEQIRYSEERYYTRHPENFSKTGRDLFGWLDGPGRQLQRALDRYRREPVALAIATDQRGLAHLPWEVLHDGQSFLVERRPWIVPIRWVKDEQESVIKPWEDPPRNRPLQVLFMATSPRGVTPELGYEAEEGAILKATQRKPLFLQVEESGCLQELADLVREEEGFFDVVHLTGHAGWHQDQPFFWTETEYGDGERSGAEDLVEALTFQGCLPQLIFLSGCRTGYASGEGSILSLAERLLRMGAISVLGWGQRVLDEDASGGAAALYGALAAGSPLLEALAITYGQMVRQGWGDWHQLRLYVSDRMLGALVTPVRTPGRQQLPPQVRVVADLFREGEQMRVVSRELFVGRRRQLQNCLRALKDPQGKRGVVIHGMGGLGKSTIASRLLARLPRYTQVFWRHQIDSQKLVKELCDQLIDPVWCDIRQHLNNQNESLEYRLKYLFREIYQAGESPLLLVLDDFEWNLDPEQGRYFLQPHVAEILEWLVKGIEGTDHRILITCRYKFESDLNGYFYFQGLDPLQGSDLQKKLKRLPQFQSEDLDRELIDRALKLADGNPRLLEWLDQDVLGQPDADDQLSRLELSSDLWKEKIIWRELYDLIDDSLQQILSQCLVYELPVPMRALEAVCDQIPDHQALLQRAIELSLLEVSADQQNYRVSRVLPRILTRVCLPADPDELYGKALDQLRILGWDRKENRDEEQWRELFRVWFGDATSRRWRERRDPERFRQGFSHMISIQVHKESDQALEKVLRGCREDLTSEGLCSRLETLLEQQEWKAADEETAWIFYQTMVIEKLSSDWDDVIKQLPLPLLQEIDRLWSEASEGRFGFKRQKEIFIQAGGSPGQGYDKTVWNTFGDAVQWRQSRSWLDYSEINWDQDAIRQAPTGYLPLLCLLRYRWFVVLCGRFGWGWWVSLLSSRPIETSP